MSFITQYNKAVSQRGIAVQKALGTVEAILRSNPNDTVAMAYKGSLLTIVCGEALLPWNELKYVNVGLELIDKALATVATASSHELFAEIEILMVAGFTNSRLPAMFKREPMARQNISRLIAHESFKDLQSKLQAQALAIAAAYAKKDGDKSLAQRLLSKAEAVDAGVARSTYDEHT